ncbi:hypothetical protein Goarm_000017 [Gossypium armourianum]|uniref:Uncharacterized protein n=1 Tax=Gossypium armourianum TaxID=34283 RepID=A0A7J9KFN5_9ROSI|nr:hypothetical protein [Gossypium armourianum]
MKVDKHLFRALAQFWNPSYSTPRCEEEGRCLCFEYIRLSCLPQGFGTC